MANAFWERSQSWVANVYVTITHGPACREDRGENFKTRPVHHGVSVPAIALSIAVRQPAARRRAPRTAALSADDGDDLRCRAVDQLNAVTFERLIDRESCTSYFDDLRCSMLPTPSNADHRSVVHGHRKTSPTTLLNGYYIHSTRETARRTGLMILRIYRTRSHSPGLGAVRDAVDIQNDLEHGPSRTRTP